MCLPRAAKLQSMSEQVEKLNKVLACKGLGVSGCVGLVVIVLAGQVLLSEVRKEAALDLHSPFSTSHNKPVRLADRPLASPFLTSYPFASFELWPQQWGRFFWGGLQG